jgi:hypothetical protein
MPAYLSKRGETGGRHPGAVAIRPGLALWKP